MSKIRKKIDMLFVEIRKSGTFVLRDDNSEIINEFPYSEQETAIANIVYLKPRLTIVYDHLNLMDPEMAICLKKFLGNDVEFLDERYPYYD